MEHRKEPVVVEDVTKTFKDFWGRTKVIAVNKLSFDVREGEIFGLLGPNGSGKTTSLKLMLGLVFPSEGKIWVFNRQPTAISVKKRIGFLPEESYLYNFLTARESLSFYADFFEMEDKQERIEELLDLVGLWNEGERSVKEFSKGMSRRLGIAQALINDPELLLLDEPTSGLDPIGCREVKDLILNLKERGKTILICSHLLADVEEICDRIAILHQGRLQKIGTIEDLLIMKNRLQITLEGMDEKDRDNLISLIKGQGAEIVSCEEEKSRLEDLFIKTIKG